MEKKKLGTLYCDGNPELPSLICEDSRHITIGSTIPGKELKWVDAGEILVADRCVCLDISWDDLNALGFVFGHPVWINNEPYLCRCLKVGNQLGKANEWDNLLEQFGKDNDLWNAIGQYFFGQETVPGQALNRMVHGGDGADNNIQIGHTKRLTYVGFRPVLEPLSPFFPDINNLLEKRILVYGENDQPIEGILAGVDEYDILLSDASLKRDWGDNLTENRSWVRADGEQAVVTKSSIAWVKEV